MAVQITNQPEEQTAEALPPTVAHDNELGAAISDSVAALQASEPYFRQIWETTSDALALSDTEGIVLSANPAYLRLYGYTAEQLIDQNFALIFPVEQRAWAVEQYKNVFASDTVPSPFETVIHRVDGTALVVEARATFLTTDGQRTAMLSTIRDITDRKQAEERLLAIYRLSEAVNRAEAIEQIYEAALDALIQVLHIDRAAILLFDDDGVIRFKAWRGLSLTYRRQAEGHTPWIRQEPNPLPVLMPDIMQEGQEPLQASILAEGIRALAFIPLVEQGQLLGKFMLYCDQPYPFPADEMQWAQNIAQHVAHALQRKQAEVTLRQLNATLEQRVAERTRELEQRNTELDEFAAVASHDLKAPLRAIRQLTTWIAEESALLSTASQTHLAQMQKRILRMEQLLNDLLLYAQVGRRRQAPERVKIDALIQALSELLAPPPGFTVVVDAPVPPFVTERVPLETVLRNLIGNAIKHHDHPGEGLVRITAVQQPAGIEFTVTDNGPGIDPQFHKRIFQIFQTLKPREQIEGSGVGLAIVKKLVEMRGKTIEVESEFGQGATFRFSWPTFEVQPT